MSREGEWNLSLHQLKREQGLHEWIATSKKRYESLFFASHLRLQNIFLDKYRTVFGRYRKFNLIREGGVYYGELSTFETDFGVTFGNIVWIDILFFEPAK